jgi:uncharacterized repeat protein (TIGR03803 family)
MERGRAEDDGGMNEQQEFTMKAGIGLPKLSIRRPLWRRSACLVLSVAGLAPYGLTAQEYSVVCGFDDPKIGMNPIGLLARGPDGALYGTTEKGGDSYLPPGTPNFPEGFPGYGTVFKVKPDGSGFAVLRSFTGADGAGPESGVVVSGTTMYGTTYAGGDFEGGTVYRIKTDGSGFQILRHFRQDTPEGCNPAESELVLSGNALYGTTFSTGSSNGVAYGWGTVFRMHTDGTGFAVLKNFSGSSDGKYPCAGLVLSGSTLYGSTAEGGNASRGTIFRINTDGSGFEVLKHFTGGMDGMMPLGGLVVSGNTLYGTTYEGGGNGPSVGYGIVFQMNTDGTGFTVLRRMDSQAWWPRGALILVGPRLYGTTLLGGGGRLGYGTVFSVNTNGSGFAVLHRFTGENQGGYPAAGLVFSEATLYGTAGVVFRLHSPIPSIESAPQSRTEEVGSTFCFSVRATNGAPLSYQWFFEETNALVAATNRILQITNVQFIQAGAYTIAVTNAFGAVTSPPAMLGVIPRVERRNVPGLTVAGETGQVATVEYTDAFGASATWRLLGSVTLGDPPPFAFDLAEPLPPERFYRAVQPKPPAQPLTLTGAFIPAITLTGAIGSSIRVDGINQVGPTDAWFTLATVGLTNTTQLYFDVSAVGQPARLYRLVPLP